MEMILGPDGKLGILTMTHHDESLVWNCTGFEQQALLEPDELFRDINKIWAAYPAEHQDKIWEQYQKAHDAITGVADPRRLRERLIPIVRDLYELHTYEYFEHWVKYRAQLVYPSSLMDDYSPQHPRDTTYLRKDYVDLVVLVLLLRVVTPIWGAFTKLLKPVAPRQRERLAVLLLSASHVVNCRPYLFLREHVERLKDKHVEKNPVPLAAKADCLGSENLGETVFCITLVRRVMLGELSQRNTEINIVSLIYKHVKTQLGGLDKNSGGRISEKHKSREENPEDNASRAESYKAKTEVTPGSVADSQVYTENIVRMARHIAPDIDENKLDLCLRSAKISLDNGNHQCTPHQLTLAQYVLGNPNTQVLSPRSLEYPDLEQIFNVMVVTQAVLWHWGFPQLAILMFVCAYEIDEDQMLEQQRFAAVSKELRETLHKLYPYYRYNGGNPRSRSDCFATTAIKILQDDLQDAVWVSYAPDELIADACSSSLPVGKRVGFKPDGELVLPVNLPDILAQFIVKLNQG